MYITHSNITISSFKIYKKPLIIQLVKNIYCIIYGTKEMLCRNRYGYIGGDCLLRDIVLFTAMTLNRINVDYSDLMWKSSFFLKMGSYALFLTIIKA